MFGIGERRTTPVLPREEDHPRVAAGAERARHFQELSLHLRMAKDHQARVELPHQLLGLGAALGFAQHVVPFADEDAVDRLAEYGVRIGNENPGRPGELFLHGGL
jgi:hypothetical protein